MTKRTVHLVCNAHIDPVWLWDWQEGLAETLSTFRIAAEFCEQHDNFVFCHNEALLYQWIKKYDLGLYLRIKSLISIGKWRVIGAWYIQPDCNMPSGELLARQILIGKNFFKQEFETVPSTALNFDPFGHSRGLVQILVKSGYDSYLFCRPDNSHLPLEQDDFIWRGFDGSELMAHRSSEHYNSGKGGFSHKFEEWLANGDKNSDSLFLWGIGNHGGGPSIEDLKQISELKDKLAEVNLIHSFPESYFRYLSQKRENLSIHKKDLNPWAVGCYTSMARLKKTYRALECDYLLTERMLVHAFLGGKMAYPKDLLRLALEDLLFCQFHDILPGSGIQSVESGAIRRMHRAMENLAEIRTETFFSLLAGQKSAARDEYPILVYNPHPYDIVYAIIVELQSAEPNFNEGTRLVPELYDEKGLSVPLQVEKEASNIRNDHRKRLVFNAELKAGVMNRFSCYLKEELKEDIVPEPFSGKFDFENSTCSFSIDPGTGLISKYEVEGIPYLLPEAGQMLVINDYADPWGMRVNSFRDICGKFELMNSAECASFSAIEGASLEPIRIIELGDVRTVVEALFKFNESRAVVRYAFPGRGNEIGIELLVYWFEKDKMLKWALPTPFKDGTCYGEVVYGIQEFEQDGLEKVAQKWTGINSADKKNGITIINNTTYGFDCREGVLRSSLVRSPAYAGHPQGEGNSITPPDRFEKRMDQGEHEFSFFIQGGLWDERRKLIQTESQIKSEGVVSLCCWPDGKDKKADAVLKLKDQHISMGALKISESGDSLVVRLFSSSESVVNSRLSLPLMQREIELMFQPFEIKTLAIDLTTKELRETDLLEQ